MKLRIEVDSNMTEDEIVIRCRELTPTIVNLHKTIEAKTVQPPDIAFYKDKSEFYLPLDDVMFFETSDDTVYAHTRNDVYSTSRKLYELQAILPPPFVRVSKSTIVNVRHILSVNRNITSPGLVKFHDSHKQIYVSRMYFKELKYVLSNQRV
ncbi:MAG: LytTR family transcriptional regulator [Oscillospiraceae bacterium]|nr:LytTR family transcriptional regulator [Oscillospiraceae bacterium]